MENKIDIVELLKGCPKGMELDCTMYDNVSLLSVNDGIKDFPIRVVREDGNSIALTKYGQYIKADFAKCVIYPKGKTTWEGFQIPFKDGDIIYNQGIKATAIFYKQTNDNTIFHCFLNIFKELKIHLYYSKSLSDWRLAPEEEKEKLFKAIKDNGYRWNTETKTLEKLPKFKVGDRIQWVSPHYNPIRVIKSLEEDRYQLDNGNYVKFGDEGAYKLLKFDINTLKPFDKVLVRDTKEQVWVADLFSHAINRPLVGYTFACIGHYPNQCIPYEGNEHLLGTTDDCDNYFKTWE